MKQQKSAHPNFVKKRDPQCCRLCYAAVMNRYRRSWSGMQVTIRRALIMRRMEEERRCHASLETPMRDERKKVNTRLLGHD